MKTPPVTPADMTAYSIREAAWCDAEQLLRRGREKEAVAVMRRACKRAHMVEKKESQEAGGKHDQPDTH